jgi:pyruvate/2-oxoglutarate dehydrogenase complex dihydrolipoamide acyltransferase (E2) component
MRSEAMKTFFQRLSFPGKLSFSRKDLARVALPVLALGLIASVVAGRERPATPEARPAARIETRLRAEEMDLDLSKLARGGEETKADGAPAVDPFARRSFSPAQAAPQAGNAPAAAPTAPPLPFVYLGKAIEDGRLEVFLGRGEKSYSVHAKQKLDDEYRIDKVSETSITFTYLPLKTRQTLDIPAVN